MNNSHRRSFLSRAAAGVAALGVLDGLTPTAEAQLVWKASDWKLAEFQKLVKDPAQIKQVYDVTQIGEGKFLNNIKNSLNGLQYGFGVPMKQIKVVAGLHGPANLVNYDDYIWEKYKVGAWLKVTDPKTQKPANRNPFYKRHTPSKSAGAPGPAKNPDDENSVYQDTSVQALQARGVSFLSCHTAAEEQARVLIKLNGWSQKPEEIVQEMLAHALPGVLVVASMVAAVALLQAQGHYTYITV